MRSPKRRNTVPLPTPAAQRLEAFVIALIRHYTDNLPVVVLAANELDPYGSEFMAPLVLHVRTLLKEIRPGVDHDVLATMLLSAIGPTVISKSRARGKSSKALETASLALLRGITSG
jgi:hypothetical protein